MLYVSKSSRDLSSYGTATHYLKATQRVRALLGPGLHQTAGTLSIMVSDEEVDR